MQQNSMWSNVLNQISLFCFHRSVVFENKSCQLTDLMVLAPTESIKLTGVKSSMMEWIGVRRCRKKSSSDSDSVWFSVILPLLYTCIWFCSPFTTSCVTPISTSCCGTTEHGQVGNAASPNYHITKYTIVLYFKSQGEVLRLHA